MECPTHTVGALNWKYIAMKKPKRSGSGYYNYKGFFPGVLQALVDAEYRFRWVDFGFSGSSSDAHIFNHSKLKKKVENVSLGLPAPEPLRE